MALDIQMIVSQDDQVSTLPEIFYEIKRAIDDPDCSFDEIGGIIRTDPGLTSRLLKIVNSPFYGFPQKIETLPHALSIVGIDQLFDLVIATTVISQFRGIPRELMDMRSFWQHSICCGLGARIIAAMIPEYNNDYAKGRLFIAGLLHDIGRLIICKKLPDKAKKIFKVCNTEGGLIFESEREVLGFDHGAVGAALLTNWNLPARLIDTVKFHHQPHFSSGNDLDLAILQAADIITYSEGLGRSGECFPEKPDRIQWARLGLTPEYHLEKISSQMRKDYEQSTEAFLQNVTH